MSHQHDAREFREGLNDVEVAQWADLEESHTVLLGVSPSLLCRNLTLESEMEPISHQNPGHAWSMLAEKKGDLTLNMSKYLLFY